MSLAVDDAVGSVSQQCYLSYDKNAYLNLDAEKIILNDRVNSKFDEEQKRIDAKAKKDAEYVATNTIDGNDVLDALSYVSKSMRYKERLEINFAVIDFFGDGAKSILLNHWDKTDKKKLASQIDSQISSHKSNTSGGYAKETLFFHARKTGWTRQVSVAVSSGSEATYHYDKFYTTDEVTERLKSIIADDFFRDKKDKMVIVEAGAGKTRTMYKVLSEYLNANENVKVAIFLKTHEMIEEFVSAMNESINQHNQRQIDEKGFVGKKSQYSYKHRAHVIKGQMKLCHQFGKDKISEAEIDSMGTSICNDCFYNFEDSCDYLNQFKEYMGVLGNVRIYTHNRLFKKSKKDSGFKADYVIVDEDIVSMMTDVDETLLTIKESEHSSLTAIIASVTDGNTLLDASVSASIQLEHDYEVVEKELEEIKDKISKLYARSNGASVFSAQSNMSKLKNLLSTQKTKKKELALIEELMYLSCGNKLQSRHVWIQQRVDRITQQKEAVRLTFGKTKQILAEYKNASMLYLDASGEQVVIDTLFDKQFQIEHLRVAQQNNAKVYQVSNHSFSKSSFADDSESKKIDALCEYIDVLDTKKCGLIRYNRINTDKQFFKKLDEKINAINGDDDCIGWFGNVRGINRFEKCDTLIVVGQHRIADYGIFNLSQLIFREDITDAKQQLEEVCYSKYLAKELMTKVYRMKDGVHSEIAQYEYKTAECRWTSNHFDKAETYQAIHRLRLLHGDDDKTLLIFSNAVLDVSVDALLDKNKELGAKNIQVVKHIKEKHFLVDTNDAFVDAFQWNANEAKRFRDKRENGDWLQNHRALTHWAYKTKSRKTGKVYSSKTQTHDDVKDFLESEVGLEVKSVDARKV
jgi:DNA-directed RNA polymerase subunit L